MGNDLRKTGNALVEEISWGSHIALIYETRCDLLDTCAAYFGAGLESNEFCTWALADTVPVEEARRALRNTVPDFDRHEAAGNIKLATGSELQRPEGPFDVQWVIRRWHASLRQAREGGYDGLRVCSHAWVAASDSQKYHEDERALIRAIEGQPILAMGAYDLVSSSGVDVLDIVRAHDVAISRRQGEWQLLEAPKSGQVSARIRKRDDASGIAAKPFPGHELLTERERMVVAQIVQGFSTKEIARQLGVSPRTIDFHRANILHKLSARNTAEVIRLVLSPD